MKRTAFFLFLAVVVFGACLTLEPASAQQKRNHSVTISTDGDGPITDCGNVRMLIGDGVTAGADQTQILPRSAISTLSVRTPQNGGVHVQGWNREEYKITACLAAGGETESEAKAILARLKLSVENGEVTVEGSSPRDWVAYFIIQAPNGAVLDLSSTNGPIGVDDFSGNIKAQSTNGPITLREVGGQVRADVQNGPIGVSGSSGDFHLSAQNGPLTVELNGSQWSGGEIEGRTQNGPLTLKLPDSYLSSVRVDASKHSPVQCRAVQCQTAARTWDRPTVIQFGDSEPVIRLSTVNGPVTITSPGGKR
ncbi:MAG: hypothetical protein WAU45_05900 [Blastocatellia bacterium]